MKKIEYWEAEDGERFETEEECFAHENRFVELSEKVKFFNANYELMIEDFLTNVEECYSMYIPTNEIAEALHTVFEDEGIGSPFDRCYNREPKSGHYFFEGGSWYCLEEEKARINEIEINFAKGRGLI
jgi:hypothetical protein